MITVIYLTGFIVSALSNIIFTFGYERPKEKHKYWLIIPESVFWFILFPGAALIVIFLFLKRNKK